MELLLNNTIGRAESAHAHLLCHGFPRVQHRDQGDDVLGVRAVEAEVLEVHVDQLALGLEIELEFDDLGPVARDPVVRDFLDGVERHAAGFFLDVEVFVCGGAEHEFELAVEL